MRGHKRALLTVAALLLTTSVVAQEAETRPAVIWQDRGDIALLDLMTGPSGTDQEPGTDFRFLEESTSGTSPKFDVEDERGVRWKVKLGEEGRGETAAARLLWAAGYVVDEDYYRSQIRVRGMRPLTRGRRFVSADGVVSEVRLERDPGTTESNSWSWYDNPFVGTREFNGLRVLMALINNWDLKAVNNGESGASDGRGVYGITDLGAAFGRTGNALNRSKGVAEDYAGTQFIDTITPTHVDFVLHSRPFFPTVVHLSNYRFRTRMESIVKGIPIADARWIGEQLGKLSATQIGDCFRAGGFPPADVETYTQAVQRRIAALQGLSPEPSNGPTSAATDVPRSGLIGASRQAPLRETLTALSLGTPYTRAIIGGFEQGARIGGGVQLSSASALPVVELRAAALTSTRGYRRFDLEALLPNVAGSRTHADVWFTYLQRDTDFFGVGPRTAVDAETAFAVERRSYQGSLYRDLAEHLQGGVYAQVMNTRGVLDLETTTSEILSFGGFVTYDTRDNSDGLTRGVNVYGRAASADGLGGRDGTGSYGWFESEIDARAHVPLGSQRMSLLVRSRGQFKSPRNGSRIPYYDLSWLGGRSFLRGSPSYRYRGNNVLLLASELQRTVFALTRVRGIDLFASADTGQVWSDPQEFTRDDWRSGIGGGLQYRHSRSVAARVEVSRGGEGTRAYVSLSRGF